MSGFLFVVPPFAGHVNPTVSVGRELMSRGHEVAWVGHSQAIAKWLPSGARLFDLPHGDESDVLEVRRRFASARGLSAFKVLWEDVLVPLARAMEPGVDAACAQERPDVLVSDQQALAGAIVARRRGLKWATSATTPGDRATSTRGLPKVLAWSEDLLAELQRSLGVEPVTVPEDSPELVISFTTEALAGPASAWPPQYRFVGPALGRPDDSPFPWSELRGDLPIVLATLGSLNSERGAAFYHALGEALGDLPLQVVLGAAAGFGPFPGNFLVRPWVPQLRLLERVQAVVSHAGSNTVAESLAFGVPLVLMPITDGQPVLAGQVVDAGAGVRVSFRRPRAEALREAVLRVLGDPEIRKAAERVRASFEAAGGAARAADLLERLASP